MCVWCSNMTERYLHQSQGSVGGVIHFGTSVVATGLLGNLQMLGVFFSEFIIEKRKEDKEEA